MSRINRVPLGLLDLLGSNSQGDNPSDFSQVVQPVLQMLPFLLAESVEHQAETINTVAVFGNFQMIVPTGELWIPIAASMEAGAMGAGEAVNLSIETDNPSAGGGATPRPVILANENWNMFSNVVPQATTTMYVTYTWPRLIGLTTGSNLVFRWRLAPVGNTTYTGALAFHRFRT